MKSLRLLLGGFSTPFFRRLNYQLLDCDNVVDMGCCDNSIIKYVIQKKSFTGVEIDYNYYLKAKKNGLYEDVVLGDMEDVLNDWIKEGKRFDCILFNDVIEHVDEKKAFRVLKLAEQVAIKKIIIFTPFGEMEQIDRLKLESKYQLHQSYFYPSDFRRIGYKTSVIKNFSIKSIYAIKKFGGERK